MRHHPCAHDFWEAHERLCEAKDPFDPDEIDAVPAIDADLPAGSWIMNFGSGLLTYRERENEEVEIFEVDPFDVDQPEA